MPFSLYYRLDVVFVLPEERYKKWCAQKVLDNVPKNAAENAEARHHPSRWISLAAEINHADALEFASKIRQWAIFAQFNPHSDEKVHFCNSSFLYPILGPACILYLPCHF